ncbi:hypothetical protein SD80_021530 [Scytonema tolypothrichoides VB-61278]|nr:hypothetical protein SD80_021530 [Scytonema tolypothrichoides VB-61278]
MATSNTNSAASSDSVFPRLPSNVKSDIQTNISTFTDIVNQYRSSNAAASDDQPLAPVVDLVNAAYGSNSPFLNGNASGSSGNNTVAGNGSVSSGSSLVTSSSSVFPVRSFPWDGSFGASPSEVLKLVEAEISSSYNLGDQNFGVGSQLPQSRSDVLELLHSDITTFSKAIDSLQSGNNPLASASTPIV